MITTTSVRSVQRIRLPFTNAEGRPVGGYNTRANLVRPGRRLRGYTVS
jgi:hypothetical protein